MKCATAIRPLIAFPLPAGRDGDGTVPLASVAVCDGWHVQAQAAAAAGGVGGMSASSKAPATHVRRFPGVRHADIPHSGAAFEVLEALLDLGAVSGGQVKSGDSSGGGTAFPA